MKFMPPLLVLPLVVINACLWLLPSHLSSEQPNSSLITTPNLRARASGNNASVCRFVVDATPLFYDAVWGGRHVLLSMSEEAIKVQPIEQVVLLFHGCSHSNAIWRKGAPERALLGNVRQPGVLIVAFTAASNDVAHSHQCWDIHTPLGDNIDANNTIQAIQHLEGLLPDVENIPFVGIDVSSGGMFVSLLATVLQFQKIVVYIAPMHNSFVETRVNSNAAMLLQVPQRLQAATPPAMLFVRMLRDLRTSEMLDAQLDILRSTVSPHPAASTCVLEVIPRPLNADALCGLVPGRLTRHACALTFDILLPYTQNGVFTVDPREASMHEGLRRVMTHLKRVRADAYAGYHACCSSKDEGNDLFAMASNGRCDASDALFDAADELMLVDVNNDASVRELLEVLQEILNDWYGMHEMTSEHAKSVAAFVLGKEATC